MNFWGKLVTSTLVVSRRTLIYSWKVRHARCIASLLLPVTMYMTAWTRIARPKWLAVQWTQRAAAALVWHCSLWTVYGSTRFTALYVLVDHRQVPHPCIILPFLVRLSAGDVRTSVWQHFKVHYKKITSLGFCFTFSARRKRKAFTIPPFVFAESCKLFVYYISVDLPVLLVHI